ncbi:MAG: prevent-host-death protein [Nevskiaceae bacterium]|nr:MAG: prevent-host-death protein [Nevskiaceae bacterium]TBR72787.1 MAG: prevent-host-death protein [Nevskiaceae bacterium]
MKSTSFPSLRVTPEFRKAAESVLEEGETLSSFLETAVRKQIQFRRTHKEFIARGLAARDEAQRTGVYYTVNEVMDSLREVVESAKRKRV